MNHTNHISNAADRIGSLSGSSPSGTSGERLHKKSNSEGREPLERRYNFCEIAVSQTLAAIKVTNPALVGKIEMPQQMAHTAAQVGEFIGPAVFKSPYNQANPVNNAVDSVLRAPEYIDAVSYTHLTTPTT